MKKETIAYLILIAFTSSVLFALMKWIKSEESYYNPKPKQATPSEYEALKAKKEAASDMYPYYGADTLHSEIKLGEDDIK